MTYTFKLARRLARLRSMPAIALSALLACTAIAPSDDPGDPPVGLLPATLDVTPSTASISTVQTIDFQAVAHTDSGFVVGVDVLWSASGGSITQNGGFQASYPGTFQVVAIEEQTGIADTAQVTVIVPPTDTVATSVIVSPSSATVVPDQPVAFEAWGKNAAGDSLDIATNWTASGGTMGPTGAFHASTPGSYKVIATLAGGTLADTATVTVTSSPTDTVVTTVIVSPGSATVIPDQSVAFQAWGRNAAGDSLGIATTWTASGGTMGPTGVFRASTTGTYKVIATLAGGTPADTATVTVTAAPQDTVITTVIVSPGSAAADTGQNVTFHAWGENAAGDSLGIATTWSASGGVVSSSGVFHASTAGSYEVIARLAGGTPADTATVTVTAPPPPPPSGLANECASPQAGWIWCDDFDQDRLSSYFEYDASGGDFVRASGAGNEGSFAMQSSFGQGQVNAGSLHLAMGKTPQAYFVPVDAGTANYRELYWRVYVRHQAGWTGGGGYKLSRATSFASSTSWAQAMIAHVWTGGTGQNFLAIDPASGTDVAGNLQTTTYNDFPNLRWLGADASNTPIFDAAHVGVWYCVEAHVKLNSAGNSDGVFEMWIDGNVEASNTGLNWVGSFSQYGLNAVYLENYWNGGSPAAQTRWFDNFVVSTQRITCQ